LFILASVCASVVYSLMIIAAGMIQPWQGIVAENHVCGTGAAIQELLGTFGLVILVVALSMGIFTGLNGFVISSSRLLFAMSRAKTLPKAFSKLHPRSEEHTSEQQ